MQHRFASVTSERCGILLLHTSAHRRSVLYRIRRGCKHRPAPILSGHHLLPSLEVLILHYFELSTELVLDAPNLTKCHLVMPDGRSSTPVLLRLKASCPQLNTDAAAPIARFMY